MYNLLRQWLSAGLIVFSLGGCYLPNAESNARLNAFSSLPVIVTLRLSDAPGLIRKLQLQINERVQATVIATNRTAQALTLRSTASSFLYVTAYENNDIGSQNLPVDLSVTSRGNAQILFPPPQTKAFTEVEVTVQPNRTISTTIDVRFSSPGIYLIRGVLRVSVTNDGPASTNEVLIYSPPTIVEVR